MDILKALFVYPKKDDLRGCELYLNTEIIKNSKIARAEREAKQGAGPDCRARAAIQLHVQEADPPTPPPSRKPFHSSPPLFLTHMAYFLPCVMLC